MASNYSSDPNNAASLSKPATPQSGPGASAQSIPHSEGGSREHSNGRRLQTGTELSFGRYKIERSVAAGGMGAVYLAIDQRFNRPCAVKEMLDDFNNETERAQSIEWFRREATLLLDLKHPCIPSVRDFFDQNGKNYLVMDFIEGRTLAEVFAKEGNVPGINGARGVSEARARNWARQICSVLAYLHSQNPPIIFRDLKPSNIMVTSRDEIKLIDFGIARTFQSQRQSTVIMTIGYAPPEQMQGNAEPRSDLYALGATIHRVLTQHDPANNKPDLFSFPIIRSLRPDVSVAFDKVIMKALMPQVGGRWSSAIEMERAIDSLPPITVQPPQPLAPTQLASPPIAPQTPVSGNGTNGPAGNLIRTAQDHLLAGRIEPAFAVVQQAFALEPNNALVHKVYGQVFARRQPPAPDLAIQAYNRSLVLNPSDAETHKLVGDVFLYLRKVPTQAIQPYTQSLRLNTGDFETHQRLAKCYESTGQLDAALNEYQEAVRLLPPNIKRVDPHFDLGQLALRMNQLPMAERAFVQVLTLNAAFHDARFLLSQVYEREGKMADALRECSYVVQAAPGNQAAQAMLQRLRGAAPR